MDACFFPLDFGWIVCCFLLLVGEFMFLLVFCFYFGGFVGVVGFVCGVGVLFCFLGLIFVAFVGQTIGTLVNTQLKPPIVNRNNNNNNNGQ